MLENNMPKRAFNRAGGAGVAVTPRSLSANAARRSIQVRVPLGTSTVTTQTVLCGIMPAGGGKVTAIKYAGQAAVTGTSLTAEVQKLSADGNTATTLQSAATDIKLTASTDEVAQSASLTATTANLTVAAGAVLQCVVTSSAITAGPGDLLIDIEYIPSEDTGATVTTGANLL